MVVAVMEADFLVRTDMLTAAHTQRLEHRILDMPKATVETVHLQTPAAVAAASGAATEQAIIITAAVAADLDMFPVCLDVHPQLEDITVRTLPCRPEPGMATVTQK